MGTETLHIGNWDFTYWEFVGTVCNWLWSGRVHLVFGGFRHRCASSGGVLACRPGVLSDGTVIGVVGLGGRLDGTPGLGRTVVALAGALVTFCCVCMFVGSGGGDCCVEGSRLEALVPPRSHLGMCGQSAGRAFLCLWTCLLSYLPWTCLLCILSVASPTGVGLSGKGISLFLFLLSRGAPWMFCGPVPKPLFARRGGPVWLCWVLLWAPWTRSWMRRQAFRAHLLLRSGLRCLVHRTIRTIHPRYLWWLLIFRTVAVPPCTLRVWCGIHSPQLLLLCWGGGF